MFTVSLELFEHIRSFFGIDYMLCYCVCVLEYDLSRSVRYGSIGRSNNNNNNIVENIAGVSSAAVNTRPVCCYLAVPVLLFLPVLLLRSVRSCLSQ